MRSDRFHQIGGPAVMQEKDPLSNTPQRSRPELVWSCTALRNAVGEALAHVVHQKIGEQIHSLV